LKTARAEEEKRYGPLKALRHQDLARWKKFGILPYADLKLHTMFTGNKFPDAWFARKLKDASRNRLHMEDRSVISATKKELADAMRLYTLERLEHMRLA
jgi:hypothetical protein